MAGNATVHLYFTCYLQAVRRVRGVTTPQPLRPRMRIGPSAAGAAAASARSAG